MTSEVGAYYKENNNFKDIPEFVVSVKDGQPIVRIGGQIFNLSGALVSEATQNFSSELNTPSDFEFKILVRECMYLPSYVDAFRDIWIKNGKTYNRKKMGKN